MKNLPGYRRLAVLAAIVLLNASCNSSYKDTELNMQTAGKLFAAFNQHDWKAMAGYYTETTAFLDPSFGKEYVIKNRQETIDKYTGLQKIFPGIKDSIVNIFAFANKVTVEFISGDTGWKLPICTVFTFKNGLITTDATYYDNSK